MSDRPLTYQPTIDEYPAAGELVELWGQFLENEDSSEADNDHIFLRAKEICVELYPEVDSKKLCQRALMTAIEIRTNANYARLGDIV